jgi:hypothetical protein
VPPQAVDFRFKLADKLRAIAVAIADEAVTPAAVGCCGFACDRGFLHAELTRSATSEEIPSLVGGNKQTSSTRDSKLYCVAQDKVRRVRFRDERMSRLDRQSTELERPSRDLLWGRRTTVG